MRPPPPDRPRPWRRWLLPSAGAILAPKCVVCLAAYAGLGTAWGLGGPELCGVTNSSPDLDAVLPWGAALAFVSLAWQFSRCSRP